MGYASSNSADVGQAALSKLFPPYLTRLLGTSYPITDSTSVLDNLPQLLSQFGTSTMDTSVKDLGYIGYVNLLNTYYLQQNNRFYDSCGVNPHPTCPSIYYLPYQKNGALLDTWPPAGNDYWGISGGGGSGAGYQSDYVHLCTFQHAYVICELTNLLYANHFTSADIPTWLINPHCTDTQQTLVTQAGLLDGLTQTDPTNNLSCTTAMQNFYQAKAASCTLT